MSPHGEHHVNGNGNVSIDFTIAFRKRITNTLFRKENYHKCIWATCGSRSITNYVLANVKFVTRYSMEPSTERATFIVTIIKL